MTTWHGIPTDFAGFPELMDTADVATQVYNAVVSGGIDPEAARQAVRAATRAQASGSATTTKRKVRKKYRRNMDPAYYVGPFSGYRSSHITEYEKYGCLQDAETYGQNSMNDCNYIGCASVVPRHMAYSVGVSFIRYVAYKHFKLEYKSLQDAVSPDVITGGKPGTGNNFQAIGFYLDRKHVNRTTGDVSGPSIAELSIFDCSAATLPKTVHEFATWFADSIVNNGYWSGENKELYQLKWYRIFGEGFGTAAAEYTNHAIDTMKVKLYSNSSFSIQNSTKSDESSSSTDVINANPVKGKCYVFKGLYPKWREEYLNQWTAMSRPDAWSWTQADGVHMVNGNPELQFKMPPSDSHFKNLEYKYPLFLNPGEIKTKRSIVYTAVLSINQFIKLYNTSLKNDNTNMGMFGRTPGELHLFCLEQVVRTGTQPIVLNYQQYRRWGSVIIPPKKQIMPRQVWGIAEANHPA